MILPPPLRGEQNQAVGEEGKGKGRVEGRRKGKRQEGKRKKGKGKECEKGKGRQGGKEGKVKREGK